MASRDDVIATAQTYLDGIMHGDGSKVLLAPDAWRVEQGLNSGKNAEEIRRSLDRMGFGPSAIRDLRWFVDGEQAVAFYALDFGEMTAFLVERFRVVDGLITEIEVLFHGREGAKLDRWPLDPTQSWPQDEDGNYLIH